MNAGIAARSFVLGFSNSFFNMRMNLEELEGLSHLPCRSFQIREKPEFPESEGLLDRP